MTEFKGKKIGYAICGSFCTFAQSFKQIEKLLSLEAEVTPILSFNASTLDTRFGTAKEHITYLEALCNKKIIASIVDAEPIGPKKMFDILIVAPCTGNTLAKLATGVTDTPVTMAVKSHLRNGNPVVLALATNDALAGAAKNLGLLESTRNYYFVPMYQDDYENKPTSMVADFEQIPETLLLALKGKQLRPLIH